MCRQPAKRSYFRVPVCVILAHTSFYVAALHTAVPSPSLITSYPGRGAYTQNACSRWENACSKMHVQIPASKHIVTFMHVPRRGAVIQACVLAFLGSQFAVVLHG